MDMPHQEPAFKSAIESLLVTHYPGLRLLLVRRVGDPALAADLLNQAVCVTLQKWQAGRIENPPQIAGYVFQVALNLFRNHRRQMSERPEKRVEPERLETLTEEAEPSENCSRDEIVVRLRDTIGGLGAPRDRAILTRFYLDEEEKSTICRDMGLDLQQFHRVLHRARTRLRKVLEGDGFRECDI
jgi:RNA polymerase sigma-70 factor (ECF subfamily)